MTPAEFHQLGYRSKEEYEKNKVVPKDNEKNSEGFLAGLARVNKIQSNT
jgi:hypothetical protein